MSGSRGALAAVAATGALAAAGPALGIDMSQRSPFLPPPDGSFTAESLAVGGAGARRARQGSGRPAPPSDPSSPASTRGTHLAGLRKRLLVGPPALEGD